MRALALALALCAALAACRTDVPRGTRSPGPAKTPISLPSSTPAPNSVARNTPAPPTPTPTPTLGPIPTPRAIATPCSIAAICTDPPPIGNQNGTCLNGNGNGNTVIGQPCAATPTPSPPPSNTPPPLRDSMAWIGLAVSEAVYSNEHATAANIAQYADLCNGFKSAQGEYATNCPGPGRWGLANGGTMYFEAGMGFPNTSGHDTDIPYGSYLNATGRTCNAAAKTSSGNFWKQQTAVTLNGNNYTLPDYSSSGSNNWFLFTNGGTVGNVANMGWGWTGANYRLYINLNSASQIAYVNDVIANCDYNTGYPDFNTLAFIFQDNAYFGLQSKQWDKWDRYPQGKNFGTGSTSPYADPTFGSSGGVFNPTNFFNAASHTRTTLITSNDTPINMATDTSWRTAQTNWFAALKHRDGSAMGVSYNGFLNTDQSGNKNTNTRYAVAEEMLVGCFGTCPAPHALPYNGETQQQLQSGVGNEAGTGDILAMRQSFDDLAALYQEVIKPGINTQIAGMFLADQTNNLVNSTTTSALGTGIHQQNQLWEYAPIISMYADDAPDMTAEFSDMCGIGSSTLTGANCMDVWPFDFVMPSGRITAMPADPKGAAGAQPCGQYYTGSVYEGTGVKCITGGGTDPNVECGGSGGTLGQYCTSFNHFWIFQIGSSPCTAFDRRQWSSCAADIGPAAVIINSSGANMTISAANIAAWFPTIGSNLQSVLVPCTPTSAYWGSGAGSPVYAMPQSGTLGYGTANVCSGTTGDDVPSGGTFDYSHALSTLTANSQILYPGQVLYLVAGTQGTAGNVAVYDGCSIGKAGDPYNADISAASIDANSAAIIAALPNDTFDGAGGFEDVNTATNATALFTINTNGGHNPPFWNVTQEPWASTFFIGTTVDQHAMVLNTDNCKEYEGYKTAFASSTLKAYSGGMWDFTLAYSSSTPTFGLTGTAMASDLCFFCGMIKWNGEIGAPTPVLNHALNFGYPTGQGVSQWGIVAPAQGPTGIACTGTCTHPLHYGDHLRLHASFTCPSDAEAKAICTALKTYGMFYADQGSPAFYLSDADNAGTTNPYDSAVRTFLQSMHITDFDVLTESAINCQPGHSGCT